MRKEVAAVAAGALLYLLSRPRISSAKKARIELALRPYRSIIEKYAKLYGVDPALVKAVIWTESKGDPYVLRYERHLDDHSYGLMQLLLSTATELGFKGSADGLFDPDTNIRLGTMYLAKQLKRYGGNVAKAVAAYNAGSARYKDGKFVNQKYVDRVMNTYRLLKEE